MSATILDRARPFVPTRREWIDAGWVATMGVLALVGLHHTFGGVRYLVIGLWGLVLGVVVVHVLARLGQAAWVHVAALAAALVVLGSPAVPEVAVAGWLPGPDTPLEVARGVVSSWKGVLTAPPPVGFSDGLGVMPLVLGLIVGAAGIAAARIERWAVAPVVPALAVLGTTVAFGTREPVSVLVQGGLFAAVAVAGASARANRTRRGEVSGFDPKRLATSVGMLALVAVLAVQVDTVFAGADEDRYLLRDQITPPFDPRNEPSPLGAMRTYVESSDEVLFVVEGVPAGERVRLATMDTYDGVVWMVGGPNPSGSSRFERLGSDLGDRGEGDPMSVTVEVVADRIDVWVPTVGLPHSASFAGARPDDLRRSFRFNRTTQAAATPVRLASGDAYVIESTQHPVRNASSLPLATRIDESIYLPSLPTVPEVIGARAAQITDGAATPLEQALALEAEFTDLSVAYYSDGGPEVSAVMRSAPGHSLYRLTTFLSGDVYVGNSEQYAASMALMARSLGLPARVVMGFDPAVREDEGVGFDGTRTEISAGDVHAWVEIAFEDIGWVAFDPTPPRSNELIDVPPSRAPRERAEPDEMLPPDHVPVDDMFPTTEQDEALEEEPEEEPSGAGWGWLITVLRVVGLVSIPLLLVAIVLGPIIGLKWLRTRRRRRREDPVGRVAGAWAELCDRARDRGVAVPRRATRREIALQVRDAGWSEVDPVAVEIDRLMFGPDDPELDTADAVWEDLDRIWNEHISTLGRRERVGTLLSPKSLRRPR